MTDITAIVRLHEERPNDCGLLVPIILEGKDILGLNEVLGRIEFPNSGKIFVPGLYSNLKGRFKEKLFRIRFRDNEKEPQDLDAYGHCYKLAQAYWAEPLGEDEYIDIIDEAFSVNHRVIQDINYVPGKMLFLRDAAQGCLYGPFSYDLIDGAYGVSIRLKAYPQIPGLAKAPQWAIMKIDARELPEELLIETHDSIFGKRSFLRSYKTLLHNCSFEYVDYIDDNALFQWINKLIPKEEAQHLTIEQVRQLRNAAARIEESNPFVEERIKRIAYLLEEPDHVRYFEMRNEIIQEYVKSEAGQSYLDQYVKANAHVLLQSRLNKIIERADHEFKEESSKYMKIITDLREEIERLEEIKGRSYEEIEQAQKEIKSDQLQALDKAIEDKQKQLEVLTIEQGQMIEWRSSQEEKLSLQKQIELLDSKKKALEIQVADLESRGQTELIRLKPYADLLQGINNERGPVQLCSARESVRCREDIPAPEEYITELEGFFRRQERALPREDIVNILVSISQAYITVFTGLPGVGKTSTVNLLAEALGLADSGRFVEIPVDRGWSSPRDLVGYYNPLQQRFERASTPMYEVMHAIHSESSQYLEYPPFWVLLDEANLSPLEYYWSNFLSIADKPNHRLEIGREELQLTEALKFIATVNYDGTTEMLSGRLLDRAHVILLEPAADFFSLGGSVASEAVLPLPYGVLNQYFNSPADLDFQVNEERLLRSIIRDLQDESLGGLRVVISPRTIRQIQKYCAVARGFMPAEDSYRALDYAVAQKILPRLQGHGAFVKRLEALQDTIKQYLPRSSRILERMIRVGQEEHAFYRFFC